MGMTSGNSLGQRRQSPRSIKPLNMRSGSMQVLDEDTIGDDNNIYDEEGMPQTAQHRMERLSDGSSIERLNNGGRNSMGKQMLNTEMQHYKNGAGSSLAGNSVMRRNNQQRARSTIYAATSPSI
jgi:hypothetical protein